MWEKLDQAGFTIALAVAILCGAALALVGCDLLATNGRTTARVTAPWHAPGLGAR